MNIVNETEKNKISSLSNNSFNQNNNKFSLLFTNIRESKKLLKNYKIFTTKYFEAVNSYYMQLTEFNFHFLMEHKFKSSVINSPIFLLGRAIKKAVQAQINNLYSIITNQKIFSAFADALSNLSKLLDESPTKFGKNSSNKNIPNSNIKPVIISLLESFAEIETKVIDDYIDKKYKKRVLGLNDEPLKDKIDKTVFLEKTFLDYEEGGKRQLLNDFQDMEIKTTKVFNEMKNIVINIIDILKNNNNSYLDELQNEIYLIGKMGISNNINNINNINDIDTKDNYEKNEQIIKDNENLDLFKYKIKIINNPKIQVIDKEDENIKTEKKEIQNNIKIKEDNDKNEKNNNNILDNVNKERDIDEDKENKDKIEGQKKDFTENNVKKEGKEYKLEKQPDIINDSELILNEEDIYNIVSILYNYNFKMLDESEYNLDKEKEKIKVIKLSKKLLSFNIENNIHEIITDEEVNTLYELLSNKDNIMKFFIILNNYRSTGRCQLPEKVFNIIANIFNKAVDNLFITINLRIKGLILILSQTFYIMENGKKKYLQKVIKDHALFKKEEFWENYLIEYIEEEIINLENNSKNLNIPLSEHNKKIKIYEIILSKIIPISSYMNEFEVKEEIILNISNKIFEKYQIDEEKKIMILSLLQKNN